MLAKTIIPVPLLRQEPRIASMWSRPLACALILRFVGQAFSLPGVHP